VLGNLTISITVYNKEEIDGFLAASSAILTAADARGNWNIGPGEIIREYLSFFKTWNWCFVQILIG